MVVEVGDKVVVYGAGTDFAFAQKIEPVNVGDSVNVITLSDGTKLAMPRISLNTDQYVWVIPGWDTPSFIFDRPFWWDALTLGMGVYTLTGVPDCNVVTDTLRTWAGGVGNWWLIPVSGAKKGVRYNVVGFADGAYTISIDNSEWSDLSWDSDIWVDQPGTNVSATTKTSSLLELVEINRWVELWPHYPQYTIKANCNLAGAAGIKFTMAVQQRLMYQSHHNIKTTALTYYVRDSLPIIVDGTIRQNTNYPENDILDLPVSGVPNDWIHLTVIVSRDDGFINLKYGKITPYLPGCQTVGLSAGDKYVIVDKTARRFVFDA